MREQFFVPTRGQGRTLKPDAGSLRVLKALTRTTALSPSLPSPTKKAGSDIARTAPRPYPKAIAPNIGSSGRCGPGRVRGPESAVNPPCRRSPTGTIALPRPTCGPSRPRQLATPGPSLGGDGKALTMRGGSPFPLGRGYFGTCAVDGVGSKASQQSKPSLPPKRQKRQRYALSGSSEF